MSRQTVVKLIDDGELLAETPGTRRRLVTLDDVLAYRARRREAQYRALLETSVGDDNLDENPATIADDLRRVHAEVAARRRARISHWPKECQLQRPLQRLSPELGTIVAVADETLARLGSIAEQRWGLFTTAQAATAGVARKQLSRMASAGAIERVAHGVYRVAGAPQQDHEAIYATWLVLGGATNARTEAGVASLVAAGTTAAVVHEIGNFLLNGFDFIVPARKGTRHAGVRLRIRPLTGDEVMPANGLPTLTVERTIADLVDIGTDMSLVADAVRDAVRADKLVSPERLVAYLDASSRRDGSEIADDLFERAGVNPEG